MTELCRSKRSSMHVHHDQHQFQNRKIQQNACASCIASNVIIESYLIVLIVARQLLVNCSFEIGSQTTSDCLPIQQFDALAFNYRCLWEIGANFLLFTQQRWSTRVTDKNIQGYNLASEKRTRSSIRLKNIKKKRDEQGLPKEMLGVERKSPRVMCTAKDTSKSGMGPNLHVSSELKINSQLIIQLSTATARAKYIQSYTYDCAFFVSGIWFHQFHHYFSPKRYIIDIENI